MSDPTPTVTTFPDDVDLPERRLFQGVILQALRDATTERAPSHRDARRADEQPRARQWFERAEEGFRAVCEYAGLDPDRVRAAALDFIQSQERLGNRVGKRRVLS